MRNIYAPQPSLSQPQMQPGPPQRQFGAGVENVPPEILAAMLRGEEHLSEEEKAHADQRAASLSDMLAQKAMAPAQNAYGAAGNVFGTIGKALNEQKQQALSRTADNNAAATAGGWMPTVTKNG